MFYRKTINLVFPVLNKLIILTHLVNTQKVWMDTEYSHRVE